MLEFFIFPLQYLHPRVIRENFAADGTIPLIMSEALLTDSNPAPDDDDDQQEHAGDQSAWVATDNDPTPRFDLPLSLARSALAYMDSSILRVIGVIYV